MNGDVYAFGSKILIRRAEEYLRASNSCFGERPGFFAARESTATA